MTVPEKDAIVIGTAPVAETFVPRRWLRNGHAQTLAGSFLKRGNQLPEPEERLFSVEPEVQVLCRCHWQSERQHRLTVFLVHGLEGSSESQYMIGTGSKAWLRGWNVVRMNVRNCGGTEQLGPTLYHSGLSADIQTIVTTLIEQDRLPCIALAGFSMGGNQVLKCMGEWGSAAPRELIAAAAVSPAADLSLSADALHKPANRIYEWFFLSGLVRRLKRKAALFPGRFALDPLQRARSIRLFDEFVTARHFGFAGAEDYYTRASASRVLEHIARPTLVIHALDDPFVVLSETTEHKLRTNPAVSYVRTEHGGHCAFIAKPDGDDGRWAEQQIMDFFGRVLPNEVG
jgi:predicted alpha/beta-fold hydrolase